MEALHQSNFGTHLNNNFQKAISQRLLQLQRRYRAVIQLGMVLQIFKNFKLLESVWNLLQNLYDTTHLTLGMLLHYLGKLKTNFLQIFSRYKRNANKLHFKCSDFNYCTRVTVYAECIYAFLSKSCPRRLIPCWLLTITAMTSTVTNLRCHKLIAKVKK